MPSSNYKVKRKKKKKKSVKTNDIVSITTDYNAEKTKVLLANGELWSLNKETSKFEKKETGNVKKYTDE